MDIIDVPKFDDILLKISEVRKKKHFDRRKRIITLSRSNSGSPTQHSRSTSKIIITSTLSSGIISPREIKTDSFNSNSSKLSDKLKTHLAKLPTKQEIFLPDKLQEVKKYYGNKGESPRNPSDRNRNYRSYKLDAAGLIFESLENLMKDRLRFIVKQVGNNKKKEEAKVNGSLKKFDIENWWNSIEKRPPKIKVETEETLSLSKSIGKDLSPTQINICRDISPLHAAISKEFSLTQLALVKDLSPVQPSIGRDLSPPQAIFTEDLSPTESYSPQEPSPTYIKTRYSPTDEPEILKRSIRTLQNLKSRPRSPRDLFKIPSRDQLLDAVSSIMNYDTPMIFSTFDSSPNMGSASRIEVYGENTFDSDNPLNILLTRGTAESHDSSSSHRFNPVQSRCSSPSNAQKVVKTKDYKLCVSSYNSEAAGLRSNYLIGGAKICSFVRGKARSYKMQSIYKLQLYTKSLFLVDSKKISSLKSYISIVKSYLSKRIEKAFSLWRSLLNDDKRLEGLENVIRSWREKRLYIKVFKTWRQHNENNIKVTRGLEMLSMFRRKRMTDYFESLMCLVKPCNFSMSSIKSRYMTPSKRDISFDFM
jgi:hypothetical protein